MSESLLHRLLLPLSSLAMCSSVTYNQTVHVETEMVGRGVFSGRTCGLFIPPFQRGHGERDKDAVGALQRFTIRDVGSRCLQLDTVLSNDT